MNQHLRSFAALSALTIFVVAAAGDPSIDVAKSSIVATFTEENVPVMDAFKRFSGRIDYDAAHPAAAKANVVVATGSLDTGSKDYNTEVSKKEWLDSGTYPNATFVSTAITPGANGHFTATGTLSLKGRTQTLRVPVTVSRVGTATAFDGTLQISRKYFAIGSADWNGVVSDVVSVTFHILE